MLEDFIRTYCEPADCHSSIYVHDGEVWSHAEWKDYRNPAFRHRPQPILCLSIGLGYWLHIFLVLVISFALVAYQHYLEPMGAPSISSASYSTGLLTMATFFVSLLLVFKLNNAYSRWWEARTQWGTSLSLTRGYLSIMNSWATTDIGREVAVKASRWIPAAMLLFKAHLREGEDWAGAVKDLLQQEETRWLSQCENKPLAAAHVLNQLAIELSVHPIITQSLQTLISQLILQISGAERIFKTPLPQSYHRFTSRACMLYIFTVPLLILPMTDWFTPLISVIIAFMLLGVEHISAQIEEPFRVLHLDALCNSTLSASREPWTQHQDRGVALRGTSRDEVKFKLSAPIEQTMHN